MVIRNEEQTIADKALADAPVEQKVGADDVVVQGAEQKKKYDYDTAKYVPGNYRSDKYFRLIKALTYEHTRDANGNIQKTTGTWAKPSNVIIFQKGVETKLTADDLALPAVRSLIDRKVIYRIG